MEWYGIEKVEIMCTTTASSKVVSPYKTVPSAIKQNGSLCSGGQFSISIFQIIFFLYLNFNSLK